MTESMPTPSPRPTRRRLTRALVLVLLALSLTPSLGAETRAEAPSVVHPMRWPDARTRGLVDPDTETRISALLAAMTVEEKVGQIIQTDISTLEPGDLRRYPLGAILAGGDVGVHDQRHAPPAAWLAVARDFHAVSIEARPNHTPIPLMFGIDAVHGHNKIVGAVLYPHNIALGAAHDADLVRRIGIATAEEVAATGIDWTFAPMLAVPQDARWGRTYEGYSEDPAVVRAYAAAIVEGLQGPTDLSGKVQAGHIAATAKHFIADGATAQGVDQGNAVVNEDDLIRIHAQGYPAAIDAGALTVMASYSSWQGQKMHDHRGLLTDVLKGRMGFEGFVIGDWNAHAQVPGCSKNHCARAFNAGIDMFMAPAGWRELYEATVQDVHEGQISITRLDDAVRRILRVKFKLGLFDTARPFEGRFELVGSPAHRSLAREAVRKSLVLLKNDGVLPIRAAARVLIVGHAARDMRAQAGGWSITWQDSDTSGADFPEADTLYDGLSAAIEAGGGTVTDSTDEVAATRPDVAIVVFGEDPYAEWYGDLKFPIYNARAPLTQLRQLRSQGVPVVAVFLSGRPLWVNPELNAANAFVAAWLPGSEGAGVADVLIGDTAGRPRADFKGRLPYRWPLALPTTPFAPDHTPASRFLPVGYGLSYAHNSPLPVLPEDLSLTPAAPRRGQR